MQYFALTGVKVKKMEILKVPQNCSWVQYWQSVFQCTVLSGVMGAFSQLPLSALSIDVN